jgi:hypothetical protein
VNGFIDHFYTRLELQALTTVSVISTLCKSLLQALSYPLLTESLAQMLPDSAENMSWCPMMHEPSVLSFIKMHLFQECR